MAMLLFGYFRRDILLGFLKALLNDLSYLMDDSLDRIADIQSITAAQEDSARWQALSSSEQKTKTRFKQSQACPLTALDALNRRVLVSRSPSRFWESMNM
jgi:hypothetical protein